jgi:hypothetical protein
MTEYLSKPWFWVSVLIVSAVVHWVMSKVMAGGATS